MLHQTLPVQPADSAPHVQSNPPGILARLIGRYGLSARQFLVIAAIAFWLGGFTFYAGVAIPMGVEVLGSHKVVGFVTQRVTNWLNVSGVCTLAILLWNIAMARLPRGSLLRRLLWLSWLLMAMIEVELICLHPIMDGLLSAHPRRIILDEDRFEILHHVYLISTTVQWCIGVVHVWCVCRSWQPPAASTVMSVASSRP